MRTPQTASPVRPWPAQPISWSASPACLTARRAEAASRPRGDMSQRVGADAAERDAPEKLWEPSAEAIERSNLTRYTRWLAEERGVAASDYAELWQWSVDNLEDFWASIWDYFGVEASGERSAVLAEREMPGARWFEGTE